MTNFQGKNDLYSNCINKQNPKLVQTVLKDGRASLALEYYLGRTETPVIDEEGNHVLYSEGAMAGRPKYKIKHNRKRENLNLYIWLHPRSQQERTQTRNPFRKVYTGVDKTVKRALPFHYQ